MNLDGRPGPGPSIEMNLDGRPRTEPWIEMDLDGRPRTEPWIEMNLDGRPGSGPWIEMNLDGRPGSGPSIEMNLDRAPIPRGLALVRSGTRPRQEAWRDGGGRPWCAVPADRVGRLDPAVARGRSLGRDAEPVGGQRGQGEGMGVTLAASGLLHARVR